MMERLQKVLARAGIASRRASEELITSGRVQVNGAVVSELGTKVEPGRDEIRVDGRLLDRAEPLTYLVIHKPVGTVSTVKDPEGRPTVLDLVPDAGRLYPAGRLDVDSEGLLLLTNDGEVTLHLTHPRYGQRKEYLALVRGIPTPAGLQRLLNGVELEGGPAKAVRANVVEKLPRGLPDADRGMAWVDVVVLEGRKRLVRRMLEAIGHPVARLMRIQLGPLKLGDLAVGQWRRLGSAEVSALRRITEPGLPHSGAATEEPTAPAGRRVPGKGRRPDSGPRSAGPDHRGRGPAPSRSRSPVSRGRGPAKPRGKKP
jgi:23S rRNA pseudouridine2605 synthase